LWYSGLAGPVLPGAAKGTAVQPTLSHRLVVPADTNHHGTLYAGSLLRMALEAGYATAWRHIGSDANLVLRRVLNLECLRPVPVGTVIELQGMVLHRAQAYLIVGLFGTPLSPDSGAWMEALLGFAQVDDAGRPANLPNHNDVEVPDREPWIRLYDRLQKLLRLR
jgi:acyl-CoA thioesterase YciA